MTWRQELAPHYAYRDAKYSGYQETQAAELVLRRLTFQSLPKDQNRIVFS
jgi:hypothetical protein